MEWEEYEKKFYHLAKYENKDEHYIETCLSYAEKIYKQGLPVIYDQKHLALLIGYEESYLIKVSNSPGRFYRSFKIPKKGRSGLREISEPLPNLKNIQKWILSKILSELEPSSYSKAFRTNYSIKDNARFHRKQKKVLTIDIENYFGSIKSKDIYLLFRGLGYSNQVSVMLTNICVLNEGLPQGAPTSPMLSNLVTKSLDKRIAAFTSTKDIRYTRYADDLTFSGDFQEGNVIRFVKMILESEGFSLNEKKTRVRYRHQQQEVTGIVVNEKLQASRKYRRDFRQNIYFIKKYGLEDHLKFINKENDSNYLYHLIGVANFILNVNPKDEEVRQDMEYLRIMLKRK